MAPLRKQQTGPPTTRPFTPWSVHRMSSEGPIVRQELPDFNMAGPRIHPSRLQQMSTGNGETHSRDYSMNGSAPRSDDAGTIGYTRTNSPAISVATATQVSRQITERTPSGVFVRGQLLPLVFHVLAGPLQKVAEMTIAVSVPSTSANLAD